jgi:hypothetical protein
MNFTTIGFSAILLASFARNDEERQVKTGALAQKLIRMRCGEALIVHLHKNEKEDRRTMAFLTILQRFGVCRVTRRIWWRKSKFKVERTRRRRE